MAAPSGSYRKCRANTADSTPRSLSEFTDEEIAREYFWRAQRKLGDPRIAVGFPFPATNDAPK